MNKQIETFSYNPPINLAEEGRWLLAVTFFEATNSVFIITDENISFSIIIPSHWQTKPAEKTIDELNNLSELRFQNGIDLHVKENRKTENKKIRNNDYKLSDCDTQKRRDT